LINVLFCFILKNFESAVELWPKMASVRHFELKSLNIGQVIVSYWLPDSIYQISDHFSPMIVILAAFRHLGFVIMMSYYCIR